MRKVSVYKCPVCGMRFKSLSGWGEHIERLHPDTIPDGYSVARYFYYVDTGKTHGSCVQCHKPTEWNETTGKYSRYCSDPNCKKKYCAEAKKRMVDKYGVPHLLNDPDQQRKMLASKSKPYKFRDGGSVLYLSSYEKDFLMTCEFVLGLKSKDIMGPSPHTYTYMYEGKQHFYIPDFYIPDLNLEIEIKDGNGNPNNLPHIVEHDRHTEKIKDEVMIKNPKVNYFKVVNKEYQDFYRFLLECKLAIDDDMVKRVEMELLPATEAVSGSGKIKMMTKSDFEKIPDSSTLHLTRDAYLARLKADPKVFDKISCYGLYDGKSYPVGFFSISNDTGCVELLVVDEKERRKGYGTTLLNYAFNNFGGKYLEVRKSNAPAIGLYEKYGLHVTDEYQGKTEAVYRMAPATEAAFINHKDEYFNIDKWQRKKDENILYVTGLSGSGKSTVGKELAKKHKAVFIELDVFAWKDYVEDAYEYWNPNGYMEETYAVYRAFLRSDIPRFSRDTPKNNHLKHAMYKKIFDWLYKYCQDRPDILFIWEGIAIFMGMDREFFIDKPMIIKGTSMHTSFKRMTLREANVYSNEQKATMDAVYKQDEMILEGLRKFMRANAEKSPVLESSASSVIWDIFHADEVEEASVFEHVPQPATESSMKSNISKDYTSKGKKSLSDFTCLKMTPTLLKKYEAESKMLKHAWPADETHDSRIWLDGDKLVGDACVSFKDPDYNWISTLEIRPEYQGYGLGNQLLNFAVKTMKGNALRVDSDNEVAHKMYTKYGFKPINDKKLNSKYATYDNDKGYLLALESALTSKERTDFGLPDIKKYPMPDAEHVMLAIKFFNYVNEDREKELADAINAKITEFGITDINIGKNNRFGKYYNPAEDSVMTGWAPNVPYSGIVAKESAMPEFVYEPIKFNDRLWQSYQGKRYYPLYIGLMKNISPLGTVIRSFTKENWSHSFISFDPSMGECFTFGNKVIKKGIINARGFGAGIESFNPKANYFSYPPSTEYALHVMFFEESQIKAVKNTVDNIFAHREKYRYNVGGLINYIFNNPKTDPENLFCSQFVALVINSGKQGILDRDPSLYSPGSLADLRGTFYVCNGTIKNYDKLKAEIRTKEIFNDIIKTQNIEALEHSSLTYNADWEDSEDIELTGGYMVP